MVLIGNLDAEPNVAPQLPNVAHAPASLPKSRLRPTLPPNLQYQSVISVVLGDYHFGALTSTGKLLTWGSFANGALGLGDPVHDLDVGVPGGFRDKRLLDLARSGRFGNNGIPDVQNPSEVIFDRAEKRKGGKREHYVFGAAAAGWHTGALVIDLEVGAISSFVYTQFFSYIFYFSRAMIVMTKK